MKENTFNPWHRSRKHEQPAPGVPAPRVGQLSENLRSLEKIQRERPKKPPGKR